MDVCQLGLMDGIRILITFSSNVKLSGKALGTKTVVSGSDEYIYNVWDIVTK